MTDQEMEAYIRANLAAGNKWVRPGARMGTFLVERLDAERERVKTLEHALREGIRVVTMMEKALRSCQEIIEAEDYCECDMCCQLRDTIKGVLNAQAISHDNT